MAKLQLTDRNKGKLDKNGKKRKPNWQWRFEIMIAGKKKSFSKSGFRTKAEAEEAGTKAFLEYTQGSSTKAKELFYSELIEEWKKVYFLELRPNSVRHYEQLIRNHILPALGNYKLIALDHNTIQEFVNDLKGKELSPRTIQITSGLVKRSLNYAVQVHYLNYNPAQYVRNPKIIRETKQVESLTYEEIEKIFSRFPECDKWHLPLMIGYHTGLRISEVFALTWDNVDLENNYIFVEKQITPMNKEWYFAPTKTESSTRRVKIGFTLSEYLKRELLRQKEKQAAYGEYYPKYTLEEAYTENGEKIMKIIKSEEEDVRFVCVNETGKFLTPKSFLHCAETIRNELGIHFNFHILRHTHATILAESGANPKNIQIRLGHANISTTFQTYIHSTETMDEETASIFEKNFSHKSRTN